jgi:hypothetical protein
MDTVPRYVCFNRGRSSGVKYRGTSGGLEPLESELELDPEAMYDQMDSPPVPVAEGSPACAKKSFDTAGASCKCHIRDGVIEEYR